MQRFTDAHAALDHLRFRLRGTAGRLWMPGTTGEPTVVADAFRAQPELAAGLTFVGAFVPGINRVDWAGLHPEARAETTFAAPDWRASLEAGRVTVRPLAYSQTWRWLQTTPLDAAVLHVSPPDSEGLCSFGVAADFGPAILARREVFKLAVLNPAMPRVVDGPSAPLAAFDAVLEADSPLLTLAPETPDPVTTAIAERVAALIPDGASVQVGIGRIGTAALGSLTDRRALRIHSGLIGDAALALMTSGAVQEGPGAVVTGMAAGSTELYAAAARDPRVRFVPVPATHGYEALAAIPRFCAINSAVEIDLLGQADAETVGGRAVSGVGGLGDFLRGAQASPGGVPIVALPSTARGGAVSRIVPRLSSGVVSAGRTEVGVVVTEHGVADLRGLDLDQRARALTAVAAPEHREALEASWAARKWA